MKMKPHLLRTDDMSLTELYKHREELMKEMAKVKTPKPDVSMSVFTKWIDTNKNIMDSISKVNRSIKYLKSRGYKA